MYNWNVGTYTFLWWWQYNATSWKDWYFDRLYRFGFCLFRYGHLFNYSPYRQPILMIMLPYIWNKIMGRITKNIETTQKHRVYLRCGEKSRIRRRSSLIYYTPSCMWWVWQHFWYLWSTKVIFTKTNLKK